ncbi:response regulator [Halomonas maura]|uniref:response regulator n=1 Tax=Halomonas maura TaxID=117606 RepID=UPI0025B4EA56|nr:response regulator [Halomonas maura]MDN3556135.1 response regulator [Halomonas maura]
MRVETPKELYWNRLVRPILWPVLTAQAALVALCLVIGLSGWWLVPSQATWSTTFWLLLALLVGSGLNVAVFLTLLRQRLRTGEARVEAALGRVASALTAGEGDALDAAQPLDDPHATLVERLDALASRLQGQVDRWRRELDARRGAERRLADDLEAQRGRLARLATGRERAREESRLKSDYLNHLQQVLTPLMASVGEVLDSDLFRRDASEAERAAVQGLHERLADTAVLLENLVGAPALGSEPVSPGRVLIVDDGPVNLMLAQQVLERQGLQVSTATSGADALTRLDKQAYDLVFMDIYMTDMDGVETCRTWRTREVDHPDRPRSVVVALTANAGDADRRRFRAAGMDDYLAKPYRPHDLLEVVKRWLPGVIGTGEGA